MVVLNKFSMWLLIEILSLNSKLFVMEFVLRECMCFYLSVWKHINFASFSEVSTCVLLCQIHR